MYEFPITKIPIWQISHYASMKECYRNVLVRLVCSYQKTLKATFGECSLSSSLTIRECCVLRMFWEFDHQITTFPERFGSLKE